MVADLFHYGHLNLIKRAKNYGSLRESEYQKNKNNNLIITLYSDEVVTNYKRSPIMNQNERKIMLESCKYVDKVLILDTLIIPKKLITEYKIDYVIHAHNEDEDIRYLKLFGNHLQDKFMRIDYTKGISTTDIIKNIKNNYH